VKGEGRFILFVIEPTRGNQKGGRTTKEEKYNRKASGKDINLHSEKKRGSEERKKKGGLNHEKVISERREKET